MKQIALFLVLTAPLFAQEQDVDNLIEQLGHDEYSVRERSTKELIKLGTKVVEKVQLAVASKDAEVSTRARTILTEIEYNRRLALAYKTKPSLNLSKASLGATIFDEFRNQTGIVIMSSREIKNQKVTAAWENMPLMQALDDIAAQVNATWTWKDDDTVLFVDRPFIRRPASYQNGFKAFVFRTDSYRAVTDDINTDPMSGTFWAYLAVRVDPGIVCLPPRIEIAEVTDSGIQCNYELPDTGSIKEPRDGKLFLVKPLSIKMTAATRWASIRGKAVFVFPIATKDVEMTSFQNPTTVEGFTITPLNVGSNEMQLLVTKPGQNNLQGCVDLDALEVEDEMGNKPSVTPTWSNYSVDSGMISLSVSTEGEGPSIKIIRFKLRTDFVTKEVPFDFKRIEIP